MPCRFSWKTHPNKEMKATIEIEDALFHRAQAAAAARGITTGAFISEASIEKLNFRAPIQEVVGPIGHENGK